MCVSNSKFVEILLKINAPGEARTHGLQIMRLTRCLLRYGSTCIIFLLLVMIQNVTTVSLNFGANANFF